MTKKTHRLQSLLHHHAGRGPWSYTNRSRQASHLDTDPAKKSRRYKLGEMYAAIVDEIL